MIPGSITGWVLAFSCCCVLDFTILLIIIIITMIIVPNIFLAHTPAGAESDLNAAAAAPSQTEVTDLNCSDQGV